MDKNVKFINMTKEQLDQLVEKERLETLQRKFQVEEKETKA